jgi:peptidoglycan hydrolase-like protein with peptidoglycan-binding domain
LLCVSLILSFSSGAYAAGENHASVTEADELRAVTEQFEKLRENPKERRRLIVIAQMLLGRFGYGVGPFDGRFDDKTRRAIKYYQEFNKLPATGELDFQTMKKLTDDADWMEQILVQLPPYAFSADTWDVSAAASGTWIIVNGRQTTPVQTTKIQCNRAGRRCIESTAVVDEGDQLVLSMNGEEVERWNEQEIVTKPKVNGCLTETLRLSRSQKTVTRLVTAGVSEACRNAKAPDAMLQLESGVKVWTQLNSARRHSSRRVMKTGDFNFDDLKE